MSVDCRRCGANNAASAARCEVCTRRLRAPLGPRGVVALVVASGLLALAILVGPSLSTAARDERELGGVEALELIGTAQAEYYGEHGRCADLSELAARGLVPASFAAGGQRAYELACRVSKREPSRWIATATPRSVGAPSLAVTQAGVVYARSAPFVLDDACAIPPDATPVER